MFKCFFNLFDGHQVGILVFYSGVFRCNNDTVSTGAHWVYNFVLDWQLEARAEDFPGACSISRVGFTDLLDLFAAVFGCCLNHASFSGN